MLQDRLKPTDLVREIAAFVLTVACAFAFHWKARDLIWGLWASSLCVGYSFIVATIITTFFRAESVLQLCIQVIVGVLLLAFITFHFGMFHYFHSLALNSFFPLIPGMDKRFPNIFVPLAAALTSYWPFVLATFVSRLHDFKEITHKRHALDNKDDALKKPYLNVIRMHILIFVFAGMSAAGITQYAIYPVLVFYFFPWGMVFGGEGRDEFESPRAPSLVVPPRLLRVADAQSAWSKQRMNEASEPAPSPRTRSPERRNEL